MGEQVTEPQSDAPEPAERLLTEADLAGLDAEWRTQSSRAQGWRARADSEEREADALAVVRDWLAPHVGKTWEQVRAIAQADFEKAQADADEAGEALRQAEEWHRDVVGAGRYLRRLLDEAQAAAGETTEAAPVLRQGDTG